MTSQMLTARRSAPINDIGTDDITQAGKVVYNAFTDSEMVAQQINTPENQCFLGGEVTDDILSIHVGSILLRRKTVLAPQIRSMGESMGDTHYRVFSSLNRLPRKSPADTLADIISRYDFAGIAGNYTTEDRNGQNSKRDLVAHVGGLFTVVNTGTHNIRVGDWLYWDIPPNMDEAESALHGNPQGRGAMKILPWLMPIDPARHRMHAIAWRDNIVPAVSKVARGEMRPFENSEDSLDDNVLGKYTINNNAPYESDVVQDACVNMMAYLVDLLTMMNPLMDTLEAAAKLYRQKPSGTAHLKQIEARLNQLRATPAHPKEVVDRAFLVREMLLTDPRAADLFSKILVPENDPAALMFARPPGSVGLAKDGPLRVFDKMQHQTLRLFMQYCKKPDSYYLSRVFARSMSSFEPGCQGDIYLSSYHGA